MIAIYPSKEKMAKPDEEMREQDMGNKEAEIGSPPPYGLAIT